jgi:hydrogenase nickel incorporation protein HypB
VVQVNTGVVCHLDAHMLGHALEELAPAPASTLIIENVGNLVCPAMFDLGEADRLVVWSVTEGEDKPIKYPHMFARATAIVLSKIDLAPHVPFDEPAALEFVRRVCPRVPIFRTSARTGEGFESRGLDRGSRQVGPGRPAVARSCHDVGCASITLTPVWPT